MSENKPERSDDKPVCPQKPAAKKLSSLYLLSLSAAVMVFSVSCAMYMDIPLNTGRLQSLVDLVSSSNDKPGSIESSVENLPPYESDVMTMQVRHLVSELTCNDSDYSASTLFDGKVFPVTEPMEAEHSMSDDKVFFMLNGANDGVYVSWNGQFDCLGQAAEVGAAWLGADLDQMESGVRLYSQMGWPVRNKEELSDTKNIVHVLLDFQLWQWPGVKKGYKYVLEDGVTLTTVGISPKVFDVEFFLTQEEADKAIEIGLPHLNRSRVAGTNSSSVVSNVRTSHTAFLPESLFTRDFQKRSARVARLPSPSYVARMQLVRYAAGEFYRQHLDTFHSRDILPKGAHSFEFEDYVVWTKWAAEKIRGLDQSKVPETFREGGPLFPNGDDPIVFPNALLEVFYDYMNTTNRFKALYDSGYDEWIRTNLDKNTSNMVNSLMDKEWRPSYFPLIVKSWEEKLGVPGLHYTFPKHDTNSVTFFFDWIRWAKERVAFLGDMVPLDARPGGSLYPRFTVKFQGMLLDFILDDYTPGFLIRMTNSEWYDWMMGNRKHNFVLFQVMQVWPQFAELTIRTWETRLGNVPKLRYKMPKYVHHFHPQRYVTLFLYLNNQTKMGGETVFPLSTDRYLDEQIVRDGMDECSLGLALPPRSLHASLFYVQTANGIEDVMSRHGGCPPHEGVKWGANLFMWNSDATEGADFWSTK
ncbi:unnamed protein product [Peronospora belbahrii]|uniref:Prolyl 4-hydroxylase alpha subunit domain-containing protein n=1 Tax=Peronospora belbahrii TaxID=622444 RepID=A0ABN8D4M8_9STRA|nr:unnamed protein product [Peronospora belbahrii]